MKRDQIKTDLKSWISAMCKKYTWLQVKYEYSETRGVYLVSFSPVSEIERSDEFNVEAMAFADILAARYGDDAPLFTDEEELFHVSVDAIVCGACISYTEVSNQPMTFFSVTYTQPFTCEGVKVSSNCRANDAVNVYALAA